MFFKILSRHEDDDRVHRYAKGNQPMPEELFTLSDIARILKLKPHVVNYAMLSGRLPEVRRVGGRRLFTLDDLATIAHIMDVQIVPELQARGRL